MKRVPYRIDSDVLKVTSETFVQPDDIPPVHSHQITEPLVGQFVRDNFRYELLVGSCRPIFVNKQKVLPGGYVWCYLTVD